MAAAYRESGGPLLARKSVRLDRCGDRFAVWVPDRDPGGAHPVNVSRCRDPLCPDCSRARAHLWAEKIRPLLCAERRDGRVPRFVTLTQRALPGEIAGDSFARLAKAFTRLKRRKAWKIHVRGYVASREATWEKGRGWHVHLHMVTVGRFWDQQELSAEWQRATGGDSYVVDIREASEGVERELLKYAAKTLDVPGPRIAEIGTALHRRRRITTGGDWYGRVTDDDLEQDDGPGGELWEPELLERKALEGDPWAAQALWAVRKWIRVMRQKPQTRGP